MPLSNYALDIFVSQQMSQLTECNAASVAERCKQAKFWVSNFVLNSIFGGSVSQRGRTFAFFFLRRAEAAFTEYEYARLALIEFVSAEPKKPSLYFRASHHFADTELEDAIYAKLGVTSRLELPGLPKGPYYNPIDLDHMRAVLRQALENTSENK